LSAPIGYFKEDGKTRPIHAPRSKRGYSASAKVRVPHVSKYAGLSLEEARRLHEGRSPVAQGTDEGLKAPVPPYSPPIVSPDATGLPREAAAEEVVVPSRPLHLVLGDVAPPVIGLPLLVEEPAVGQHVEEEACHGTDCPTGLGYVSWGGWG
jgi:hypothetical protein